MGPKALLTLMAIVLVGFSVYIPINRSQTASKLAGKDEDIAQQEKTIATQDALISALKAQVSKAERANAALQQENQSLKQQSQRATEELRQTQAAPQQQQSPQARQQNPFAGTPQAGPQEVSEPEIEEVVCRYCEGDFRHPWVTCEKKGGVGCAGKGYRNCFKCLGRGEIKCTNCDGDGKISVPLGAGKGFDTEPCNVCSDPRTHRSTGKVDCPECATLYIRLPLSSADDYPPIISQQEPLGGGRRATETIVVWGHTVRIAEYYGEWIRADGSIICPRCDGRGMRRESGTCSHCKEGKIVQEKPQPQPQPQRQGMFGEGGRAR